MTPDKLPSVVIPKITGIINQEKSIMAKMTSNGNKFFSAKSRESTMDAIICFAISANFSEGAKYFVKLISIAGVTLPSAHFPASTIILLVGSPFNSQPAA